MGAKIEAAMNAVKDSPCQTCVIASGNELDTISSVLGEFDGKPPKGTLFVNPRSPLFEVALKENSVGRSEDAAREAREKAEKSRQEARKLLALNREERRTVLKAIGDALLEESNIEAILEANAADLEEAERTNVDAPLLRRLKLTREKLQVLSNGIKQIADKDDPLNVVKGETEVADGLVLEQVTVPIGVLMIIFESRPDSLPQIASLAVASGNGLMLKGGKEAMRSNVTLHKVIGDAIEASSAGRVSRDLIALITSRSEIAGLLKLDDCIDLVIPRGSNALVQYIKSNTKIPVLGHADGVCHVYLDEHADADKAAKIVVDSKTDYPAACNAMETLLLHEKTLQSGVAQGALRALRVAGVQCLGGQRAMAEGLCDTPSTKSKFEYGDLRCQVEVVSTIQDAVEWIHEYGSGHTECIVTEDSNAAEGFLRAVDAACCFHNASTRFADGFRFGMGAEVGISTGRIHARGPCGVESLLTTKWVLRSHDCDVVQEFAGGASAKKKYTHIVRK